MATPGGADKPQTGAAPEKTNVPPPLPPPVQVPPRTGQFLTVYDPRKRNLRIRYQPVALKPVEEVEGNCSSPSPPPPPPSSGSLAGPSRGHHRARAMVDSTGVVAPSTPAAAQHVGRGDSTDASVPSSRSVSQEDKSNVSSALPSLGTSREEEAPGSGHCSDASDRSSSATGGGTRSKGGACSPHPPLDRSKSMGERQWANLRAVVALYGRLRQIKRTKSNQRWMKLRTTVQLSGAISNTIQKKAPLKREDSFLKRFSTRQVAEQQETMDAGEDSEGGGGSGGGTGISHCTAKARRRRKLAQEKRSVVNPDENVYFYWLMVLTVCVLYNLWTLIVRQSFPELQRTMQPTWFFLDALTDVIFLLDIAVQFRTGYLEQGLVVYNSKKLASHYIHSRAFMLDVSSLLPLDLLQFNLGINPILRFPRFLKVYRIYDYYYMVESRTVYPNLWRVVNLVHILLILAHWFGCFYFLLSEAEGFQGEWVYPYRPGDYATLSRMYLGSLYWSTLTLTTIGDLPTPETNAEGGGLGSSSGRNSSASPHANNPHPIAQPRRGLRSRLLQFNSNNGYIFTIVSYLIGVFIFATIVGQVGNVITNRNANRLEFERLLDGAKTYMRHHKVPGDMKRRVLRWYDYSWSRGRIQGGGDINTALGLLPDKLKTELALHVNLSVLKKVTIFQECQPEFLHDLVLKMKAYIFTPGDLICRKGEVAREMFIIADGILEVISETGRVLTTMKAGDFFGEIGILNLDGLNKRTADVRSVGYSELFSLSREDVLAAMKDYPEAQEILQSLGRKRLMEARNVNKSSKGAHSASKRRISGEHAAGAAGDSSDSTGKRIVDKIRCDVKGLKNVLRKSRRSTSSRSSKEDSIELQPLTKDGKNVDYSNSSQKPPRIKKLLLRSINVDSSTSHDSNSGPSTSSGKGVLKRMGRVQSDEAAEPQESSQPQGEVIGAGLPLLQRLLLLKAKEDKEEKDKPKEDQVQQKVISPPTLSPPVASTTPAASAAPPDPPSAGLPLIQRLRALKQRAGDAAAKAAPAASKSPPPATIVSPPPTTTVSPTPPTVVSPQPCQTPPTKAVVPPPPSAVVIPPPPEKSPPPPLPTIIKLPPPLVPPPSEDKVEETAPPPALPPPPPPRAPDSVPPPPPKPIRPRTPSLEDTSKPTPTPPPLPPPPAPPLTSPPTPPTLTSPPATLPPSPPVPSRDPRKPNLLQLRHQDSKFYMSVDDLSPEYSGLPFVKKLKILNERQKLFELQESGAVLRSASLDSANNYRHFPLEPMARSQSEACDIDYVLRQREGYPNLLPDVGVTLRMLRCESPQSPPSPESNETQERRNLKSILKKLSSNSEDSDVLKSPTTSKIEFRKLMRAQTVEGYAARHSKFAKSVTFNKDSLHSPPHEQPKYPKARAEVLSNSAHTTKSKMSFLLPGLMIPQVNENRKEEEFFGEIISGMKQVIQNHLEEVQNKFQKRFQSLEHEVKRRDEIIHQLQNRIQELEGNPITNGCPEDVRPLRRLVRGGSSEEGDISDQEETFSDQPFMRGDSVDTVISPSRSPILQDSSDEEADTEVRMRSGLLRVRPEDRRSWEDHSEGEAVELLDLPPSMSPQSLWHISLDVPPSSSSSSSSSSPLSSPPVHNQDWEVQMLADELDRRNKRQKLEGELAELTGHAKLSKSELDILDKIMQDSSRKRDRTRNLSFDDDAAVPVKSSSSGGHRGRKRTASDCVGRKTTSVEQLLSRSDTLRLRNRVSRRDAASSSGLGRQVLNARSLEEPVIPASPAEQAPKGRSSSIGHLPSGRGIFTSLSRLRLSTLSHSIRGLTGGSSRNSSAAAAATQADPESAVATISHAQSSQES